MSTSDNRNCRTGDTRSAISGIFGPAMSIPIILIIIDRLLGYVFGQDKMSENIKKRGIDRKSDTTSDRSRRAKSFMTCVLALLSMLLFNADGSIKIYLDFNKMSQDTTTPGAWHVGITVFSTLDIYIMMGLIFDNIMVGTFNSNDMFENKIFAFMTDKRCQIKDREINNLGIIRAVQWTVQLFLWIVTIFYMPLEFTVLDTEKNKFIVGAIQIALFFTSYLLTTVPISLALIYIWRKIKVNSAAVPSKSQDVEKNGDVELTETSAPTSPKIISFVKSTSYKKTKFMYTIYFIMFTLFLIFTLAGIIQINSCILRMTRILTRYPLVLTIVIIAESNYLCNTYTFIKRKLMTN